MEAKSIFDRYSSFWIVICCLPLLFFPKINLISLSERETAGIRVDDIFLLLFGIVFFWAHCALKKRMTGLERWVMILVGFSLFSFSLNRIFVFFGMLHVNASIFYCLRILEYFLFFYIGMFSAQFVRSKTIITWLFLWNLLLMLLQKAELIGHFSVSGYLSIASDRVAGIASFPSEAGLLITMMFCFLVYDEQTSNKVHIIFPPALKAFIQKTYHYWLFLLCTTLIIFTGSRIAILAIIFAFFFRLKEDFKKGSFATWIGSTIFIGIATIAIGTTIIHTESVFVRSAELLSLKNISLIEKVWDQIDLSQDPIGRENVRNENYDTSWWIRIHKWCYALKIYLSHPECYLQGIGPGFAMSALDGGFLRILTEYGLIGCLLFWNLFSSIYHKTKQLQWMVIVLLINMIFFDVYLAYKPMSLLFFVTGYAYAMSSPAFQFCAVPVPTCPDHSHQNPRI